MDKPPDCLKSIRVTDISSILTIQALLKKHGVNPKKRFGQNFLASHSALQKVLSAADVRQSDIILEIGPGLGALTFELAKRARRVVAVEKDRMMVQILQNLAKQHKLTNIEIIQKDARDITIEDLTRWEMGEKTKSYKIVANLPYYIATPIIRKFLEIECPPALLVCTIQKEVARRIMAKPPRMNVLALSVQFYANPEIITTIPSMAFWPKPEVDGAVIKITPLKERPDEEFSKQFFSVIKAGFRQPRKKLISNLEHALPAPKEKLRATLRPENIPDSARAQDIELSKWISITKTLGSIAT